MFDVVLLDVDVLSERFTPTCNGDSRWIRFVLQMYNSNVTTPIFIWCQMPPNNLHNKTRPAHDAAWIDLTVQPAAPPLPWKFWIFDRALDRLIGIMQWFGVKSTDRRIPFRSP